MDDRHIQLPDQKNFEQAFQLALQLARDKLAVTDIAEQCRRTGSQLQRAADKQIVVIRYLNQTYFLSLPDADVTMSEDAEPLTKRGHEHLVLDVLQPGYQKAPVVLYEGAKIPFPDQSFDVTILVTMLHHVSDPRALFEEVRRVTRKRVIVVEDLYHHALGRFWTICRDRLLNMEFMDHPHQFRKHEAWLGFFKEQQYSSIAFKKFYTWRAGFRILNGVYVLEKP